MIVRTSLNGAVRIGRRYVDRVRRHEADLRTPPGQVNTVVWHGAADALLGTGSASADCSRSSCPHDVLTAMSSANTEAAMTTTQESETRIVPRKIFSGAKTSPVDALQHSGRYPLYVTLCCDVRYANDTVSPMAAGIHWTFGRAQEGGQHECGLWRKYRSQILCAWMDAARSHQH